MNLQASYCLWKPSAVMNFLCDKQVRMALHIDTKIFSVANKAHLDERIHEAGPRKITVFTERLECIPQLLYA